MILEASTIALSLLLATQTTPSSRNKQQQQEILDMVGIGTKDQGRSAPDEKRAVHCLKTFLVRVDFPLNPKRKH